jgi:hypothetical protein
MSTALFIFVRYDVASENMFLLLFTTKADGQPQIYAEMLSTRFIHRVMRSSKSDEYRNNPQKKLRVLHNKNHLVASSSCASLEIIRRDTDFLHSAMCSTSRRSAGASEPRHTGKPGVLLRAGILLRASGDASWRRDSPCTESTRRRARRIAMLKHAACEEPRPERSSALHPGGGWILRHGAIIP